MTYVLLGYLECTTKGSSERFIRSLERIKRGDNRKQNSSKGKKSPVFGYEKSVAICEEQWCALGAIGVLLSIARGGGIR